MHSKCDMQHSNITSLTKLLLLNFGTCYCLISSNFVPLTSDNFVWQNEKKNVSCNIAENFGLVFQNYFSLRIIMHHICCKLYLIDCYFSTFDLFTPAGQVNKHVLILHHASIVSILITHPHHFV